MTSPMILPSQLLSTRLVQPAPHPHAFLLHSHHQPPNLLLSTALRPPSTSTRSHKLPLTDLFYSREEIRHSMGIALPGYPPTGTRHTQVPAYVIPAGIT